MIPEILNNSLYGEILILFIIFCYIYMRIFQRKFQKVNKMNNLEFWIYYNLVDYYKDLGYPYPEKRALLEINTIKENTLKECNLKPK